MKSTLIRSMREDQERAERRRAKARGTLVEEKEKERGSSPEVELLDADSLRKECEV